MRLTATAAVLLLTILPSAALAQCGFKHSDESVSQCPQGTTYDSATGLCVKQSTS